MNGESSNAQPVPTPEQSPQPMSDEQKNQLQAQLGQIDRTINVYNNIKVLISQSVFKGEFAQVIVEVFQHCDGMLGNLNGQKGALGQILKASIPPVLKAVPSPKNKKGKKK